MRVGAKLVWAALSAMLIFLGIGRAQDSQTAEYRLKAAFLFNFAKFIEWPPGTFAEANSPIVIGILGDNPFGNELEESIRGKLVLDRPVVVKSCPNATAATNCHLLFISNSEKKRFGEIFQTLNGASVLTVGENDGFVEAGGMVNFVLEGNKIRFEINDATAKRAKLKISSKLLSLAVHPAH